jgi:Flp pilus assembly protein TadG
MKTTRDFMRKWRAFPADQSGSIAVFSSIAMVMLLSFAALALDTGHLVSVKSELQKAADAGALAGARALALPMGVTTFNWDNGKAMAVSAVQKNFADNRSLADFTSANVQAGYWDLSWTPGNAPANLLGYENPAAFVPASGQVAAVKVTVQEIKGGSGSSAPVATSFASVMGITSMEAKASAVAMISPPTTIPYSDTWPFALPYSWVNNHWKDDPPISFNVAASQHVDSGGQWTSLKTTENGATYIDSLILGTNITDSISVGDQIYIQSGERASIYNTVVNNCIGKIRYIPVVQDGFSTGAYTEVLAYVPFQITSAIGSGNNPTVIGHFVPGWVSPRAKGGGGEHYFGDPLPPKMVN